MFRLARLSVVVSAGPATGSRHFLRDEAVEIGRERVPIALGTSSVSRKQALIYVENGRHVIADAGGPNPTMLNGRAVRQPLPLFPGDVIAIAEHRLEVLQEPEAPLASVPPASTAVTALVQPLPPPDGTPAAVARRRLALPLHALPVALLAIVAAAGLMLVATARSRASRPLLARAVAPALPPIARRALATPPSTPLSAASLPTPAPAATGPAALPEPPTYAVLQVTSPPPPVAPQPMPAAPLAKPEAAHRRMVHARSPGRSAPTEPEDRQQLQHLYEEALAEYRSARRDRNDLLASSESEPDAVAQAKHNVDVALARVQLFTHLLARAH